MFNRALPQIIPTGTRNCNFSRRVVALVTLGGFSLATFAWIYYKVIQKKGHRRIKRSEESEQSEQMDMDLNLIADSLPPNEDFERREHLQDIPMSDNLLSNEDTTTRESNYETTGEREEEDEDRRGMTTSISNHNTTHLDTNGEIGQRIEELENVKSSATAEEGRSVDVEDEDQPSQPQQVIQTPIVLSDTASNDSAKVLFIFNDTQSEFNWAKAVEEEEQQRKAYCQRTQNQEVDQITNSTMLQQEENEQKPQFMVRTLSNGGRQHPVNSICTCSCCTEVLSNLQSPRGYKNAESPHSTHSEGSADSGRATGPLTSCSPFVDELGSEILPIYEFEVPNTLVGLIIGIKGKTIKELCTRADVRMLIRPHHTPLKYDTHQICSVEGRRENINRCLHMIRLRFPPCRFPDLNLKPVLPPPPTTPANTLRGAPSALTLSVAVPCEVYISAHVDAGHFFLQLPTHPSFSSLLVLDQYMLSVYTQPGGTPEIPKPCNVGVLCVAPAYNGWFRAITLAYDPDQDETLVRFVDYGGFARLPRADLRQIRTDFMTLPMQAIECYLANVQPADGTTHWCDKANELFQQLCISKIIQASLIGYCKQDGIPCVELHVLNENKKTVRIDQILLESGLAKQADPNMMVRAPLAS